MKKIILFTLLAIGSIFGQGIDTSHIEGYTSGAQIKAILDAVANAEESIHTTAQIDTVTARGLRGDYASDPTDEISDSARALKAEILAELAGDSLNISVDSLNSLIGTLETLIAELKGGTTGQSLVKTGNNDFNFQWSTVGIPDLSDVEPPAAPTSLVAIGISTTEDSLHWAEAADEDLAYTRIYRYASRDSVSSVKIDSVADGTEYYVDDGLDADTEYWYWLKSVDDSNNVSGFCVGDSAVTLAGSQYVQPPDSLKFWWSYLGDNAPAAGEFAAWGDEKANKQMVQDNANIRFTMTSVGAEIDSGYMYCTNDSLRSIVSDSAWSISVAMYIPNLTDIGIEGAYGAMLYGYRDAAAGAGSSIQAFGIGISETGVVSAAFYTTKWGATLSQFYGLTGTPFDGDTVVVTLAWNGLNNGTVYVNGQSASDISNPAYVGYPWQAGLRISDMNFARVPDGTIYKYFDFRTKEMTADEALELYNWLVQEGIVGE